MDRGRKQHPTYLPSKPIRAAHYKKRTAESLKRGMRLLDSRRRREATSRDDFSTVYTSPGGG